MDPRLYSSFNVSYPCEALIDQGRFIGTDPIGHACYGKASSIASLSGGTVALCDQCLEMLKTEPHRLTLFVMDPKAREHAFTSLVKRMMDEFLGACSKGSDG